MGFSLSQSKRTGTRRKAAITAEINVTPMVDVMLVLLVIFMITAPLLTAGIPVDLPKTEASTLQEKEDPLKVTVNAQGNLYLQSQETPLELAALVPQLVAITGSNPEVRIHVYGDQAISYGRVMEVMGALSAGGFKNISLVSGPPTAGDPKPADPKPAKSTK